MKNKVALITGITGQDGSYLAELLIEKGYIVHGIKRRTSVINTKNIDHLFNKFNNKLLFLHYGDLTDGLSLHNLINKIKPNEIYNLAAQSHVAVSFEMPLYTADVNALGTLRILESIRSLNLEKFTKFYQASTSELFGLTKTKFQDENTNFYPRSPYGVSKLFSYWITKNYREAYNIHASNGLLFNHESPRRGETFITRKITVSFAKLVKGKIKSFTVGNLDAKRDWGHAKDYVLMQWLILQQKKPDDYVIATGKQKSVRDVINLCAKILKIKLSWKGVGINEKAIVLDFNKKLTPYLKINQNIVKINPKYFRPAEVHSLLGSPKKATKKLNWKPRYNFKTLIEEMLQSDLENN